MALGLSLSATSIFSHLHQHQHHSVSPSRLFANQNYPLTTHLRRSSPLFGSNPYVRVGRCLAVSPGRPPPPPESDPPPTGKDEGPAATFSRFRDTVQIFFAVLFWMSLFFWSSAWDGRNKGRPGKGSRPKR